MEGERREEKGSVLLCLVKTKGRKERKCGENGFLWVLPIFYCLLNHKITLMPLKSFDFL